MKLIDSQKRLHQFITQQEPTINVEELIQPNSKLTATQRAEIYQDMYQLRMCEAVLEDYPLFFESLKGYSEEEFILEYVKAFPSQSFSLNFLGDFFVEYLSTMKPLTEEQPWLVDIAKFELTLTKTFHSKSIGTPIDQTPTEDKIAELLQKKVKLSESIHMLLFKFDINLLYEHYIADEPRSTPKEIPNAVVFFRNTDGNRRIPISCLMFDFLSSLENFETFGDAVDILIQDPTFLAQQKNFFACLPLLIQNRCLYESS